MPQQADAVPLQVAGHTVARYVVHPQLDGTLSPRPYLHPVRTLAGAVVTDALPADHRWHLGASMAVQDVSGTNLWGGRTYVRDAGYTWRADHGEIRHREFLTRTGERLTQLLHWCDPAGAALLAERRELSARLLTGHPEAWVLEVGYTLTAPPDRDIVLGSPATNGRPGGAGYGGFFWRAAPAPEPPAVFTAGGSGEDAVNGAAAEWVALASGGPQPYTLVFAGLGAGECWFVRSRMYPGVCAAFAFHGPRPVTAGTTLSGQHRVVVADGVRSRRDAAQLAAAATGAVG